MNSLFHATFSWLSAVVVSFKNSLIVTQDVTDASVNTCCKLKLVFLEKRLQFSGRQYFEIKWGFYSKLKVSCLRSFLLCMIQTSRDRDNSRRVRTHEKNPGETVRRLGTIIQSIFCAQSGASIRLNFWKQFGESRYPGALSPVLENFRPAFTPDPTDCPWVSEDGILPTPRVFISGYASTGKNRTLWGNIM